MKKSISFTMISAYLFISSTISAIAGVRVVSMSELRKVPVRQRMTETPPYGGKFGTSISKKTGKLRIAVKEKGDYAIFCGRAYEDYPTGTAWEPRPGQFQINGQNYPVGREGQKAIGFPVERAISFTGVCQAGTELLLFKLK
ncbi:hypothetical protein [Deinococcus pimensis]|uniref:hypothetical protein n=1 Tax=Deinococcus pimensis TaxID=309888 RepID=UPI0012F8EBA6|nr:hypothetical protein [Deinococcus pimensis]